MLQRSGANITNHTFCGWTKTTFQTLGLICCRILELNMVFPNALHGSLVFSNCLKGSDDMARRDTVSASHAPNVESALCPECRR